MGGYCAAFNHATQSGVFPRPSSKVPLPILQRPNQVTSLLSFRVPLCIPKRRMKSARSKSEGRNIKPSSPLFLTLLPSFLRDWGRKRRARAISPQKEDKNLPRMPRGNSNNRIRDSWRARARFFGGLFEKGGLIWGVRNNTTGVKILGIPAAIQSLPWREWSEEARGEGSAWSDAPIF